MSYYPKTRIRVCLSSNESGCRCQKLRAHIQTIYLQLGILEVYPVAKTILFSLLCLALLVRSNSFYCLRFSLSVTCKFKYFAFRSNSSLQLSSSYTPFFVPILFSLHFRVELGIIEVYLLLPSFTVELSLSWSRGGGIATV